MSTSKGEKINTLIASSPKGTVLVTAWLKERGYSFGLLRQYRNSKWFEAIGRGAIKRFGDQVSYEGAIYALQTQLALSIHPGAKTALAMQGKTHYLELNAQKAVLFGTYKEKLPSWFQKHDWGLKIDYYETSFLPPNIGFVNHELRSFSIKISSPARALMECLYLAQDKQDLEECYEILEGLNNLRPALIQELLEHCNSVKVKRLFLYMAEKTKHPWVKYLNQDKIDLGRGKRSIVKNGVYIPKYQITVPKEMEHHESGLL